MAKCTSPARIFGRKKSFCSWVPCACSVGPTVSSVTAGSGTSARAASLTKICCSIWPRPRPPYSVGQPTPSQPSRPIRRTTSRYTGPCRSVTSTSRSCGVSRPPKYSRSSSRNAAWASVRSMNITGLLRHPGAEHAEPVVGPADEPDQVLDERGVPVQRVADVHPGAAVQVVADTQRLGCLVGEPVRGHVEVAARLAAGVQPPATGAGRQVQGAAGYGDVGDVLGNRLERGKRPAELLPRGHVFGGQRERAGHGTVGEAAGTGERQLVEIGHRAVIGAIGAEDRAGDHLVQAQRVLGRAGGTRRARDG